MSARCARLRDGRPIGGRETHSHEPHRPAEPPKARLKVPPRPPDIRPPHLERNRLGVREEEEVERPVPEDGRGLEDRDVGCDAGCEGPEKGKEVESDLSGRLRCGVGEGGSSGSLFLLRWLACPKKARRRQLTVCFRPSTTFSTSPTALTLPLLLSISQSRPPSASTAGNHASETAVSRIRRRRSGGMAMEATREERGFSIV